MKNFITVINIYETLFLSLIIIRLLTLIIKINYDERKQEKETLTKREKLKLEWLTVCYIISSAAIIYLIYIKLPHLQILELIVAFFALFFCIIVTSPMRISKTLEQKKPSNEQLASLCVPVSILYLVIRYISNPFINKLFLDLKPFNQELLIIGYLTLRLLIICYYTTLGLFFLGNTNKKFLANITKKIDNYIKKEELRDYPILWYHHDDGSKKDFILFLITGTLGGILTLFVILIKKIVFRLSQLISYLLHQYEHFCNSSLTYSNFLKISVVIFLFIMELIILLNPFQEKVELIFNFLALTVIVPIIINSIKKMTNKKV